MDCAFSANHVIVDVIFLAVLTLCNKDLATQSGCIIVIGFEPCIVAVSIDFYCSNTTPVIMPNDVESFKFHWQVPGTEKRSPRLAILKSYQASGIARVQSVSEI